MSAASDLAILSSFCFISASFKVIVSVYCDTISSTAFAAYLLVLNLRGDSISSETLSEELNISFLKS